MLTVNLQRRRVTAIPVATPAYGASRRELLEDLAALTGAEPVGGASLLQVAGVTIAQLGGADRVLVARAHTEIEAGHGSRAQRGLRSTQLVAQAQDADNAHERDELLARAARLDGKGVARIAVGGSTDSEQRERTRRAEDALRAVQGALEVGVVTGGGATLVRAAAFLKGELSNLQDTERAGMLAVASALEAPARTIARNAGCDEAVVVDAVRGAAEHETYDVGSHRLVDAHARGIVEPLVVAETAFRAASSVAWRILAAEALVVQPLYGERDSSTVREGGPANLTMTRS
jgi:chaperonin GroEL